MKKLLLLFLLPVFVFSQTYEDIISINSERQFLRVVIENGYELSEKVSGVLVYALNPINGENEMKAESWAYYYSGEKGDSFFQFNISREGLLGVINKESAYDLIFNQVKEKCKFIDIESYGDTSYSCYNCSEANLIGKIGFSSSKGIGNIVSFN